MFYGMYFAEKVLILVLIVLGVVVMIGGGMTMYLGMTTSQQCAALGYADYMFTYDMKQYCIRFEGGTKVIVPLSELR